MSLLAPSTCYVVPVPDVQRQRRPIAEDRRHVDRPRRLEHRAHGELVVRVGPTCRSPLDVGERSWSHPESRFVVNSSIPRPPRPVAFDTMYQALNDTCFSIRRRTPNGDAVELAGADADVRTSGRRAEAAGSRATSAAVDARVQRPAHAEVVAPGPDVVHVDDGRPRQLVRPPGRPLVACTAGGSRGDRNVAVVERPFGLVDLVRLADRCDRVADLEEACRLAVDDRRFD